MGNYTDVFFSGPVPCDGYYLYGISFAQMIYDSDWQARAEDERGRAYSGKDLADPNGISAQTASHLFLSWVNSLDDHWPIIVMSHVPLHAKRGDNSVVSSIYLVKVTKTPSVLALTESTAGAS